MNKEQAIIKFWEDFGLPAYDENSVPDNAKLPYITYGIQIGDFDEPVPLNASVWVRSSSWASVTMKSAEIDSALKGNATLRYDDGCVVLTKGSPFMRRMTDETDKAIKRILINVMATFY